MKRLYNERMNIMVEEIKNHLDGYEIEPITKQNFRQIFEVYDTNQDFFHLVQGEKATIESSINDMVAVPPNCDIEQKIYISIWKNDKVIGILDVIEGFPDPTSFWIGLLLIHGEMHGKKIGSRIVDAVLNAAKVTGYKTSQLGVIENNTKGIAFWQNCGFNISCYSENVIVMTKHIYPQET